VQDHDVGLPSSGISRRCSVLLLLSPATSPPRLPNSLETQIALSQERFSLIALLLFSSQPTKPPSGELEPVVSRGGVR